MFLVSCFLTLVCGGPRQIESAEEYIEIHWAQHTRSNWLQFSLKYLQLESIHNATTYVQLTSTPLLVKKLMMWNTFSWVLVLATCNFLADTLRRLATQQIDAGKYLTLSDDCNWPHTLCNWLQILLNVKWHE